MNDTAASTVDASDLYYLADLVRVYASLVSL